MSKDKYEISKYTGLSYEETRKVLSENTKEDEALKFNSPKEDITRDLDEPNSIGDLEEEISGP